MKPKLRINVKSGLVFLKVYDQQTYLKIKHIIGDNPSISFADGSMITNYLDFPPKHNSEVKRRLEEWEKS